MAVHDAVHTLDATFSALADPTRRAILARLAGGETSVTQLAQPFDLSLPAISKHLKVLERAGLVVRSRDAQWRPCRLEAAPLQGVSDWVERYRSHWEERFDRLDDYLRVLQRQRPPDAGAPGAPTVTRKPRSRSTAPVPLTTTKEKPHGSRRK